MKKEKLLVRIIAGILLIVMVLCMIIPYVSATEIKTDDTNNNQGTSNGETDTPNLAMPGYSLPMGFEYELNGFVWEVVKTQDNDKPAIILGDIPEAFDAPMVTVFVGNLETYEVHYFHLSRNSNYVSSMDLEDGYYVVFTNNYAWCASNDEAYAVNGGKHRYIYIGSQYDESLYGMEFEQTDGIFNFTVDNALDEMEKIKYGATLFVDPSILVYPEDAKLEKNVDVVPQDPIENKPTQPVTTTPDGDNGNSDSEENRGLWTIVISAIINTMKKSALLLICIAGCFTGLQVIKIKKKAKSAKQIENDNYDEKRIE